MRILKYIMFLFLLVWSNVNADVMVNGQIVGLDSTNVKDVSLSVSDIANGGNGFTTKEATDDSAYAAIARGDSTKYTDGSFAIGDIASLGDRLGEKVDKTALADSLEAKGVYPDSISTGSISVTGYAQFGTAPTVPAFMWEVKSTEFYTYAADSCTVSDLPDTTGVNTMQWIYKRIAGNGSDSQKITILLATQIPSSITPDSLIVKLRSNAAAADSASIQFIVKDSDGTALLTSAQTVVAAVDTWEYTSFGGINPMTVNRVCAYQMIIRIKYDATVDVSSIYFK